LCSLHEVIIEGPEIDIVEKIKRVRNKDEEVVRVVKKMKKAGIRVLRGKEWQLEGDIVLKEGKVYVLKDKKLRVEITWLHHNILVVGHRKKWKTTELATRNYWWPGVTRDMGRYVEGCDICQRMKNRTETPVGKLKLSEIPERP